MIISDLEALLGITIPEAGLPTYQARLDSAIEHVNGECGERFTVAPVAPETEPTIVLPVDVRIGVALLVKSMGENSSVASKTLSDMSVSYFVGEGYNAARKYWRKHIKVRLY